MKRKKIKDITTKKDRYLGKWFGIKIYAGFKIIDLKDFNYPMFRGVLVDKSYIA